MTTQFYRRGLYVASLAGVVSLAVVGCNADSAEQDYASFPDSTVNVTIPFDAGGGSDVMARMVEKFWQDEFGTSLNFQYRSGAGGTVGMNAFATTADTDGYDIATFNFPHIVIHPTAGLANYSPTEDFEYICQIATDYNVAVAPADSPYESLSDYVEAASAAPGQTSISVPQAMDTGHIAFTQFVNDTGLDISLVRYQSGSEQLESILSGDTDMALGTAGTMTGSIASGDLRVLGVTASERLKTQPDWPTFLEQGYDVQISLGRLWLLPAGTPPEVQEIYESGFEDISEDPAFVEQMANLGYQINFLDGQETLEMIEDFSSEAEQLVAQMRETM